MIFLKVPNGISFHKNSDWSTLPSWNKYWKIFLFLIWFFVKPSKYWFLLEYHSINARKNFLTLIWVSSGIFKYKIPSRTESNLFDFISSITFPIVKATCFLVEDWILCVGEWEEIFECWVLFWGLSIIIIFLEKVIYLYLTILWFKVQVLYLFFAKNLDLFIKVCNIHKLYQRLAF